MKIMKILLISYGIILFVLLTSCAETTAPDAESIVRIRSEMFQGMIQSINIDKKNPLFQKSVVDSVKISKLRILISEIKFHSDNEVNEENNKLFKTGPFLLIGDSTGGYFDVAVGNLPAGDFNSLKFELHRFSVNELSTYQNDITFNEFATEERYSVILEGTAFKYGNPFPFTYKSSSTANLTFKFEPSLQLRKDVPLDIYLQINPINLMKIGNSILDPRDPENASDIDYLIQTALKAIKK